ncbi:MAG: CFI-box-CTERM domain-containing protein [Bdellovibrionota bacterium]
MAKWTMALQSVFALSLFLIPVSARALSITPIGAATDETTAGVRTIYFPITGGCGTAVDPKTFPLGLSLTNPTADEPGLRFTVAPNDVEAVAPGGTVDSGELSIMAHVVGQTTPLVLVGNDIDFNDGAARTQLKYDDTTEVSRTVAIKLNSATAPAGLCGNTVYSGVTNCRLGNSAVRPPEVSIRFVFTSTAGGISGSPAETADVKIILVDCPPHSGGANITTPTHNFTLTPGHKKIKFENASTPPTDTVALKSLVVFGSTTTTNPSYDNADIKREVSGSNPGDFTIGELINDTRYCFTLAYVNKGGMLQTDAAWSNTLTLNNPQSNCATPSIVEGALREDSDGFPCFIATAAYGDRDDPRVKVLRRFRAEVLNKFSLGIKLRNWYYSWSPAASTWLNSNPSFQLPVQLILIPFVVSAATVLWLKQNLWVLGTLFLVGTAFVLIAHTKHRIRRRA